LFNLDLPIPDYPEVVEEQSKKHRELDDNLKNVFVTSKDPPLTASGHRVA
jgi:Uncharacterised protein family (UPF0240)